MQRRLVALRGDAAETAHRAAHMVSRLEPEIVLWVGCVPEVAPRTVAQVAAGAVVKLLGRAYDAVIIDGHGGLEPDLLGQCHGFVRGGGVLVLRLDPVGDERWARLSERLVVFPFGEADVGRRFMRRFERILTTADLGAETVLAPAQRAFAGTDEQSAVVARIVKELSEARDRVALVLMADRGRGKSSALGLALRELSVRGLASRAAVTADSAEAAAEVFRHAGTAELPYVAPAELVAPDAPDYDLIVVDEAARLPVPLLRLIVGRHARACFAFATTVRGYEGTGRGFVLRFLEWLAHETTHARRIVRLTMDAPIRWERGCGLERFVFEALALDAEPAAPTPAYQVEDALCYEQVDRDRLATAAGEADLRAIFGLLVHAHYRTTPSDLWRLLDAPNVELHVLRQGGAVVAANLLAREGGLTPELSAAIHAGRTRIRAHAIPDALVTHMGHPEAGALRVIRSVRLATHPDWRRRGLAARLVAHVHAGLAAEADIDMIGTMFGASAELVRLRQRLGYEVVRLSAARGTRTGEPSVLMLRPASAAARRLVEQLRAELARDLDLQLVLLTADADLVVDAELASLLSKGLPAPASMSDAEALRLVHDYAAGTRTLESVANAFVWWLRAEPERLERFPEAERRLIAKRLLERRSWRVAFAASGFEAPAVAMRALRRAVKMVLAPG